MISNTRGKLAILAALSFVVLAACGKGSSGLLQNSEAKSSSGWSLKVLEVTQPGTVNIKARSPFGGTQSEKSEAPPADQKWVLLRAELTPAPGTTPLPAKQIKLVEGSNSYQALAMAGAPEKGDPAFVYFKESAGLGQVNASSQLLWVIVKSQNTGETEIIFQKQEAEKTYFLFAVPSAAKSLTLQL